jgi:hypothetical protein
MTEVRWEQYPLVAQNALAHNWLQRQTRWMHTDVASTIT